MQIRISSRKKQYNINVGFIFFTMFFEAKLKKFFLLCVYLYDVCRYYCAVVVLLVLLLLPVWKNVFFIRAMLLLKLEEKVLSIFLWSNFFHVFFTYWFCLIWSDISSIRFMYWSVSRKIIKSNQMNYLIFYFYFYSWFFVFWPK